MLCDVAKNTIGTCKSHLPSYLTSERARRTFCVKLGEDKRGCSWWSIDLGADVDAPAWPRKGEEYGEDIANRAWGLAPDKTRSNMKSHPLKHPQHRAMGPRRFHP